MRLSLATALLWRRITYSRNEENRAEVPSRYLIGAVLLACTFPAAMTLMATPYRGGTTPGTVERPAPAIAEIDPPKIQDRLPVHVVPTTSYRLDPPAEKVKLRSTAGLPWTCEQVRQATQGMTPKEIELLARAYRLNSEQRAEAARCLKEKRT